MIRSLCLSLALCGLVLSGFANAETLSRGDVDFDVDAEQLGKYPELYDLILNTESMDDDERQYWYDILPSMTPAQIDRLYEILDTERSKLQELERKYQKQIRALNARSFSRFYAARIKDGYEALGDAAAALFVPILDAEALPPVTIRRYDSYADIPKIVLPSEVPDDDAPESVSALVGPEVYRLLVEGDLITAQSDHIIADYAMILADNAETYRRLLGDEAFNDFIKLGAERARTLPRVDVVNTLAVGFPDLDIARFSGTLSDPEVIADIRERIETYLSTTDGLPNINLTFQLSRLVPFLDSEACRSGCQELLEKGLRQIAANQDQILNELDRWAAGNLQAHAFQVGQHIDYVSLFTPDDGLRAQARQVAEAATMQILDATIDLPVTFVEWEGSEDDEKLLNFVVTSISQDGSWAETEIRNGWYRYLARIYQNGTIDDIADAFGRLIRSEAAQARATDALKLEGPLLELVTLDIVRNMALGRCEQQIAKIAYRLDTAKDLGRYSTSSAYKYIEREMSASLGAPTMILQHCTDFGKLVSPEASSWTAVLIGVSDTVPGAPGFGRPEDSVYYLGDIPANDVRAMEAALQRSPLNWNIKRLLDDDVTEDAVIQTISEALSEAGSKGNVLIYYSGHGRGGQKSDRGSYMLLPNKQEIDISSIAYRMNGAQAAHVLALFDMCREVSTQGQYALKGGASDEERLATLFSNEIAAQNGNLQPSASIVYATQFGYPAAADRTEELSRFTRHISEVLGGDHVVGDGNRTITVQEMLEYVGNALSIDSRNQDVKQRIDLEELRGRPDWTIAGTRF